MTVVPLVLFVVPPSFVIVPVSMCGYRLQLRLGRGCGRLRQRDAEAASNTGGRLECKLAAVHFDGPLGDRQAKAGSAVLAGAGFVNAVEAIKDSRSQFGGNSGARIAHIDKRALRRLRHSDLDLAAGRTVLDRIIDEIEERLPQHDSIADPARNHVEPYLNRLILFFGQNTQLFGNFLREFRNVNGVDRKTLLAGIRARKHQETIDQKRKPIDFFEHTADDFAVRGFVAPGA